MKMDSLTVLRFAQWVFYSALVVILLVSFALFLQKLSPKLPSQASFTGKVYSLEVADTGVTRTRGLGERSALCATCGMLFVFEKPGEYPFWMKGMHFPLDIVWLLQGTVVHIERSVPWEDQQTVYRSGAAADQVLELNATEAAPLAVGSSVLFSPTGQR